MNVVLFGAPGSGKGTQAGRLQGELGLTHVASGDLFRYNLNNNTELGLKAREYMNRGDLVPDDITVAMISQRMQQPDISQGILLDGFPRTIPQAEALDKMLAGMGQKVDRVLHLDVAEEELIRRLSGRWICPKCQSPYRQEDGYTNCPKDDTPLYQREDDKPETARARLKTYQDQTTPLIDYYKNVGVLVTIGGQGSIDEITAAMLAAVQTT